MKLTAIIPTHNRIQFLSRLIEQLEIQKSNLPKNISFNIVIVADGCIDGTEAILNEKFSLLYIVRGNGNWWYTKSMNEGFKYAIKNLQPDFVLTLNDDLEFDRNYLKEITNSIDVLGNSCIIGSLSLTKELPTRVTSSGVYRINRCIGKLFHYYKFLQPIKVEELTGIHKSLVLPGRGMLIPKQLLLKLNFFDEKFPQYHSDIDFCLRAIKNGYSVYVNWDAKLFSYYLKTSNSSSYKKKTLLEFLKSFVDPYSRNHIKQNLVFFWRHQNKICVPLFIMIFFITRIRSFLIHYFKYAA